MGDQDLELNEGLGSALNKKNLVLSFSFMPHPVPPLIADHILKKNISNSF